MTSEPVRDEAGRTDDPIRWGRSRRVVAAVAVLFTTVAAAANGQEDSFDTKRLSQLVREGDYRAAIAEAASLEEAARPKAKDPAFVLRVRAAVEMLVTKARLERRIGDLDAAEETLAEAFKAYTDREFQRRLTLGLRSAADQAAAMGVPFELVYVELFDEGMRLVVDRMQRDGAKAEPERQADWLKQFDQLASKAIAARRGLSERLEQAGPPLAASPRARFLAGDIPTLELAGRFGLAKSRLPQADKADAKPAGRAAPLPPAKDAAVKLARAFDQADELLAPPEDAAASAEGREAKREADLIRADLLAAVAEAELAAGELDKARQSIERVVELRIAAGEEQHPDLLQPLILQAGVADAQRRASEAAGRAYPAREQAKLAGRLCREAEAILARHETTFSEAWHWRAALAAVAKNVEPEERDPRDPAAADAIDAATQRLMPTIRGLP